MAEGPSSFELQRMMASQPSHDNSEITRANVASAENNGGHAAANIPQFMPASITGDNNIGAPLQQNIDGLVQNGGLDAAIKIGEEEANLLEVFGGNMAPFGIERPIQPLTTELTQGGLHNLSLGEQTGANLAGNTGIISKQGGQSH